MAHRWLLVVLTAWIMLIVCMGQVATGNFEVVEPDDLRHSSEVFAELEAGDERRMAVRYVASELNRYFFQRYDVGSLALAAAAIVLRLRAGGRPVSLVALLLCAALVVANLTYFTPYMIEQGRLIDFMPRDPRPPEVEAFYSTHVLNIVLTLGQMVVLGALVCVGAVGGAPKAEPNAS